jgi:PAS domain S-box-containing protein
MNSDRPAELDRQIERLLHEFVQLEQLVQAASRGQISEQTETCILFADVTNQHILSANHGTLQLLGYTEEQLLSHTIPQLEVRETVSDEEERLFHHFKLGEKVYDATYLRSDGVRLPVRVYRHVIQSDGTKRLYYRLDEQSLYKRLWQELRRRENDGFLFQQRLKSLNEITIQLSQLDSLDRLCRQAVELGQQQLGFDRLGLWFFDHERERMIGTYGVDEEGNLRDEHDVSWSYKGTYITEFLAGKTDASFAYDEAPIYNHQSEVIHFGWHISAPMLYNDHLIGVITSDNYLHKQAMKSYEPELLRLFGITIGYLTQLVKGRDQAFTMRLEQERASMMRQFIANVGHDFRTPLSIINTKSYLMPRVEQPSQRQSLSSDIQEQVTYLSKMLDSMLEFIALEHDLSLDICLIDLRDLIIKIVANHRHQCEAKQLQCAIHFENVSTIQADALYLRRALTTLFQNAIQYTPIGGRIDVSFKAYSQELGICIQDNGIGIDAAYHEHIFKPLFRVDEARTERSGGLGLSIAKAIVEAHGGRILVTSALGKGSTFEVVLPHKQ